jgi:hypothetical protein
MSRISEETPVSGAAGNNKAAGETGGSSCVLPNTYDLKFATHYHPYVCNFIKALSRKGIPGLLALENQQLTEPPPALVTMCDAFSKKCIERLIGPFEDRYSPNDGVVEKPYPKEEVDFTYDQAYSLYNWELFFHTPLLLATRLSKNQKFEDAQQWFHYIFNPTDSSPDPPPQRYWRVLPFYQNTESGRIEDLLRLLDYNGPDQGILDQKSQVADQIAAMKHDPFNPHHLARLRLVAYQKSVVMKYIDNLIAWGDQQFSQDTMESVNMATQLYILAHDILGPRPELVPSRGSIQDYTYNDLINLKPGHDLVPGLDDFSNALVVLENEFPFSSGAASNNGGSSGTPWGLGRAFYFCVPQNDKLLGYWDTVADRLFKIRHCMNIEGVVRQLPLFAPPIDPALLVQAAAAGVDIGSVLNDLNAATPHYRFTYMLQKALELCAEVRSLGAALLAALEKKDSEALSALRASQETNLLKAVREVKRQQLDEANAALEGLNKSRLVTEARFNFYDKIQDRSDYERKQIDELKSAFDFQVASNIVDMLGSMLALLPNFDIGLSGAASSPVATTTWGGANLAQGLQGTSRALDHVAAIHTYGANMASLQGGWDRRTAEWKLQRELASKELIQIDQQIAAGSIRAAIAQLELDNHDKQMENASAVEDFLRDKYTNLELYDWMVGQTSAIFFQCYQMAYDFAKRVEKAFRFERGLTTSNYIQFGYWDSLRKGLLSGERLYLDLKRLEMAYLDQNRREYEISKHISLVLSNPLALIALKETGQCIVDLPEALFDADYPGHYMRRIKSVTLTIPCVTGPYTSINCTFTLLKSSIRLSTDPNGAQGQHYTRVDSDDTRFIDNFSTIQSIATSHAQNDSGMFELNFRDERYLPFEGAGVISQWRIEMPPENNAFDFASISDIILNLNYAARDGGGMLRDAAKQDALGSPAADLLRMFNLKHEFSSEWYRFLHPKDTDDAQTFQLELTQERFPFQFRGRKVKISQMELFLKFKDINDPETYTKDGTPLGDYAAGTKLALTLTCHALDGDITAAGILISDQSFFNGLPHAFIPTDPFTDSHPGLGSWSLVANDSDIANIGSTLWRSEGKKHHRLKPEVIDDMVMVCHYSVA